MKYLKTYETHEASEDNILYPDNDYVHPANQYNLFEVIKKFTDNNIDFKIRKSSDFRYYIIFDYYGSYSYDITNSSYPVHADDIHQYGKELTSDEVSLLLNQNKYNL